MKRALSLLAILAVGLLAGCSPEDLELSIPTKALQKARSGEYGFAEATVNFENDQDSVKEKLVKIKSVVMPYLGKSGKMTVRGDKVSAKFKIPVVAKTAIGKLAEEPIMQLVLDKGKLELSETSRLKSLNDALSDVDFSIDVDLKASHVVFKIVGEEGAACKVKATAVFVDGEPFVTFQKDVTADESVDIEFRCDNDASVYHQIKPFIEVQ